MFGGGDPHDAHGGYIPDLNDTWTWNGADWSQAHPATVPPAGIGCEGYDVMTKQFLMLSGTYTSNASTWSWDGGNWSQVTTAGTPGTTLCTMAYDPDLGTLVLDIYPLDPWSPAPLWQWTGNTWVQMAPSIATNILGENISYDSDTKQLTAVMQVSNKDGLNRSIWSTIVNQTQVVNGSAWAPLSVDTPQGTVEVQAFDPATHQLVLATQSSSPSTPSVFATQTSVYSASSNATVTPTRIAGANRGATAVAVSQHAYPAARSASAVVLAASGSFADALAGGPLAAAKNGPLLLSSAPSLDAVTATEIQRVLKPGGAVYLLGGTAALSASVEAAVAALGYAPTRIAGTDRFGTALAIANAMGNPSTVFEASGTGFADALSAVPAAVTDHGVILLTNGATLTPATAAYLQAHPGAHYAVGGPAAAADRAATALVGSDRYATSEAVALAVFPNAAGVDLASGATFPDALAGGPVAGSAGRPVLLVPPSGALPEPVLAYLTTRAGGVSSAELFGGNAAVGADVLIEVATALSSS
jgi:putative cell wall-binding protein